MFKQVPGSICAPLGFQAAAVFCDIKRLGTGKGSEKGRKRDLALIFSEVPAAVAGMFTRNKVCAPPVRVSAQRARQKYARGIVVNSGNANACTGRRGMSDAKAMAQMTACAVAALDERRPDKASAVIDRRYRVTAEDVLVCSTGRIGVFMPMKNVERGIGDCAPRLARSQKNARDVAEAILTSDTCRKEIGLEFRLGKSVVRMGGICKGAGMIQPGMVAAARLHATMLGFITTDIAIEPGLLKGALATAVDQSFNCITVDGDMSTNDSVIILANGLAQNQIIRSKNSNFETFQKNLDHLCRELAKMIVRDGEGVTRFVTLRVCGARTMAEAESAARAIGNSSLVRTSWCGGDPNWGRIMGALGYSGAKFDESMVDVGYARPGDRTIYYGFRRGRPTTVSFSRLASITSKPEFDIHVHLHCGKGEFVLYASDLTEEYVEFNKGDVTDPTSLGG